MSVSKAPPTTLLEDAEKLMAGLLRDANRGRVIDVKTEVVVDGQTVIKVRKKRIPTDIIDKVRTLDSVMRFMDMKKKIVPDDSASEYERALKEFHGESANDTGEGGSDRAAGSQGFGANAAD